MVLMPQESQVLSDCRYCTWFNHSILLTVALVLFFLIVTDRIFYRRAQITDLATIRQSTSSSMRVFSG